MQANDLKSISQITSKSQLSNQSQTCPAKSRFLPGPCLVLRHIKLYWGQLLAAMFIFSTGQQVYALAAAVDEPLSLIL